MSSVHHLFSASYFVFLAVRSLESLLHHSSQRILVNQFMYFYSARHFTVVTILEQIWVARQIIQPSLDQPPLHLLSPLSLAISRYLVSPYRTLSNFSSRNLRGVRGSNGTVQYCTTHPSTQHLNSPPCLLHSWANSPYSASRQWRLHEVRLASPFSFPSTKEPKSNP